MTCQGSNCDEEATYSIADIRTPHRKHFFCPTHLMRAERNAKAEGIRTATHQL